MILVFAGQENSPVLPGFHHLIGTCDTIAEAQAGVAAWSDQQRQDWLATLSNCHPQEQAAAMVRNARFWHQFVEHKPGHDPEFVIVADGGKAGVASAPNAEFHWARQALLAFDREDQQGTDGDSGQAMAEHETAMEHVEKWRAEFTKTLMRPIA